VSPTARAEGLELGTVVTVDHLGTRLVVIGFTDGQATFGHVDVAYLPLPTWQLIASGRAESGTPTQAQVDAADLATASVIALQATPGTSLDLVTGDRAANTTSKSLEGSLAASPGYTAETMTAVHDPGLPVRDLRPRRRAAFTPLHDPADARDRRALRDDRRLDPYSCETA